MENIILTTEDKLQELIRNEVQAIIPNLCQFKPQPNEPEVLNADEALSFLADNGYPMQKSFLYQCSHENSIPYRKRGKRLIFYRNELKEWLISRTTDPTESATVKSVIRSARNQLKSR